VRRTGVEPDDREPIVRITRVWRFSARRRVADCFLVAFLPAFLTVFFAAFFFFFAAFFFTAALAVACRQLS